MSDWEVAPAATGSDWAVVDDEEGGPESFLHPDKFKPSPQHRKFSNTGPIEQVRQDLDPRQVPEPSIENDIGAAAAPLNSIADRATFGGYGAALRGAQKLNELTGETGPTLASRTLEGIENYRGQHPTLSQYTDLPAYFAAPARAVAGGVERLLPQVDNLAARAARATLASGGTGAVMGGTEAALRGEGLGEGVPDALRSGAAGLITGAAVAAPLSLSSLAARAVLGSKGGQARQFLEGKGVAVGPGTPGRGGPMDTMVTRGASDADIGHQAEVSAMKGLGMLNEEKKGVLGALGSRYGNIANTPEAAQLQDVSGIVANMKSAAEELDTSPMARAALNDLISSVHAKQGQGFNPDVDSYMLSETDVNKLRRSLDRYAKTGQSTDASLSPLKAAANETRGMVDEGPYAQANADYSKEAKHYQQSRKLLGINERPKTPEETKSAVNTVRHQIERPGQNTITAGGQTDKMRQFAERHPDIADEFARPEILRRRADISFHVLPQKHGGLIDRGGSMLGGAATLEALSHAIGHGHFDLKTAAAMAALGLTGQNMNAINARLLYGPAQEALHLERPLFEDVPLGGAALTAAARNSQQGERR